MTNSTQKIYGRDAKNDKHDAKKNRSEKTKNWSEKKQKAEAKKRKNWSDKTKKIEVKNEKLKRKMRKKNEKRNSDETPPCSQGLAHIHPHLSREVVAEADLLQRQFRLDRGAIAVAVHSSFTFSPQGVQARDLAVVELHRAGRVVRDW